jgi:hypothetical protein
MVIGSYAFYDIDIPARLVGHNVNCRHTDASFTSRLCHWVYTHVRHPFFPLFPPLKWVMSV